MEGDKCTSVHMLLCIFCTSLHAEISSYFLSQARLRFTSFPSTVHPNDFILSLSRWICSLSSCKDWSLHHILSHSLEAFFTCLLSFYCLLIEQRKNAIAMCNLHNYNVCKAFISKEWRQSVVDFHSVSPHLFSFVKVQQRIVFSNAMSVTLGTIESQNIEWFGLEGTLQIIWFQSP